MGNYKCSKNAQHTFIDEYDAKNKIVINGLIAFKSATNTKQIDIIATGIMHLFYVSNFPKYGKWSSLAIANKSLEALTRDYNPAPNY